MPKEGEFVKSVPPRRRTAARDWDSLALKARERPGESLLAASQERQSLSKSLMQRHKPPFVTDEGRIRISFRNSTERSDGRRYGDIYMTWEPHDS